MFKSFGKENLKILFFDIYKNVNKSIFDSVMEYIDELCIITSISLKEILSDIPDNKNVIVSTQSSFIGSLDIVIRSAIEQKLKVTDVLGDIYIIQVSWLKTISLNDDIVEREYRYVNVFNVEGIIYLRTMSYPTFFKNIKKIISESISVYDKEHKDYIGINPIMIFQGLSWGNIVHLFKLHNIDVSRGSITRRHKLSICEYRLSKFIDYFIMPSKEKFYDSYTDKYVTSPRYDRNKEINDVNHPYIDQYVLINKYMSLCLKREEIELKVSVLEKEIENIKSKINGSERVVSNNKSNITEMKDKISFLRQNKVEGIREKQKASITGRIKKLQSEIAELKNVNSDELSDINKLNLDLSQKFKLLNTLKKSVDFVLNNDIVNSKSKIRSLSKNTVGDSNISNRREYHSLSSRRYNSTNKDNKNLTLNINSPIYIELQRIINSSALDEMTQMKIEQFLYNQGLILLKNKKDEVSDINYYKLNPFVLDYLKKSIDELSILIDSNRSNVNNIEGKNSQVSVECLLLNNLNNELIISRLLGRLLRIISNHNLLNKNTYCTDLASDLGNSLLDDYYSVKYSEFIKNNGSKDIGLSEYIQVNKIELDTSNLNNLLIVFGFKLLNFLVETDLIYSEVVTVEKNKSVTIYVAKDQILEIMGKNLGLFSISHKIPMIIPPKPYFRVNSSSHLGGYLLNDKEYINPIIIKNHELRDQSEIRDENIIFDTVNNLSSVGFKINIPVLDFILEKGVEYNLIIDLEFKHPLEDKKKN